MQSAESSQERIAVAGLRGRLSSGALMPGGAAGPVASGIAAVVDRMLGLKALDRCYQAVRAASAHDFVAAAARALDLSFFVESGSIDAIPARGAAIVVANHPYGGPEGVALLDLLLRRRCDVRVLANRALAAIPELRALILDVDVFERGESRQNPSAARTALRWLQSGGLLLVFPAGEVAHFRLRTLSVTDPPWQPGAMRLARLAGAPVVPVFVPGRNGPAFQLAGVAHPRLRTALLPHQLLRRRGTSIALRIGEPIACARLRGLDDAAATAYVRARTFALEAVESPVRPVAAVASTAPACEPPASAVPAALLRAEIAALPPAQKVAQSGALQAWTVAAHQVHWLRLEIGRLREICFRAVGEGTGRARDLDRFDDHYTQLVLWDEAAGVIAGAYRLAFVEETVRELGLEGLYTHGLFRYGRGLIDALGPAIELGRSFVHPHYQRSHAPLLLLWRGICAIACADPRRRVLFGPVSISASYAPRSRAIMVDYLRRHRLDPALARHVHPQRPPRRRALRAELLRALTDVDDIADLIGRIEPDGKGVPVLLRQYLKLGGRLAGFNVDPQFNDALDGLIAVDLAQADPRLLVRYMGYQGARTFLAHHGRAVPDIDRGEAA
ncbi:MAG: lysophospholipid acyltransferase family protein [Gammaproteobacteria bacterium]